MRSTAQVLEIIDRWPHREFEYGRADCCRFTAFVARELTGMDYMAGFEYHSDHEAAEILRRSDGLTGALRGIFGEPVPKTDLNPGDPILIAAGGVELLGVYLGTAYVAGIDIDGRIVEIPLRLCRHGWRL